MLKMQMLLAEIHGPLQLLRIDAVARSVSIRQRSHAACAESLEPLRSSPEADAVLCGQLIQAAALLQVLDQKRVAPPLCQAGVGLAMDWWVRSGTMATTSTPSDLTSPCQLNELLRQNS
jgi:hypothetical protein